MKANKPLILVSNDDGITSKGIRVLVEIATQVGQVIVVAPNSPQSGMGHAITINDPLKVYPSDIFPGIEAYECSGTPADCIKFAKNHLLKNRAAPDLVVSGVNHGSNTSVSVLYSGTMSAAIEAAIEGMPAIGFSLCDYDYQADFEHIRAWALHIINQTLDKEISTGIALNVNFPKKQSQPIEAIKICRQADAKWVEEFDERVDPYGRKYLWLSGYFQNRDRGEDTDIWAIENNFVSIVPVRYDMTAHYVIAEMNKTWNLHL